MALFTIVDQRNGVHGDLLEWTGEDFKPGSSITEDNNIFVVGPQQATVTGDQSLRGAVNSPNEFDGNFAPDDDLLQSDKPGRAIRIDFVPPVKEVGSQLAIDMEDDEREFIGILRVIGTSGHTIEFRKPGATPSTPDNSAIFLGVLCDGTGGEEIERIEFDVRKLRNSQPPIRSFCINQLSVLQVGAAVGAGGGGHI